MRCLKIGNEGNMKRNNTIVIKFIATLVLVLMGTSANSIMIYRTTNVVDKAFVESNTSIIYLQKNIVDGKNVLTQEMILKPNTTYIIQNDYDLQGVKLIIPKGCVLDFQGGSFTGGIVDLNMGDVKSELVPCFFDTIVKNIGNKIVNFIWFKFTTNYIPSEILSEMTGKTVDFNGLTLHVADDVKTIGDIDWRNITLYARNVKMYNAGKIFTSTCSKSGNKITIKKKPTQNINGCLVVINTGKQTINDPRWKDGSPTLFKGITSIVENCEAGVITITDEIEDFTASNTNINPGNSKETSVNESSISVYNPNNISLYNCKFILTEDTDGIAGGVSIGQAYNVSIDNCIVQSHNKIGSLALLSLTNCVNGYVRNSKVNDSAFDGTGTSYGIQLNACTRINISNCEFSNHRRSVDFSGRYETRYCSVSDCRVMGDRIGYGSALGGHSTSYKNVIKNNYILCNAQIGIQLRGELEIVDGNVLCGYYKGAVFSTGYQSTIINNSIMTEGTGWDIQAVGVHLSDIDGNHINVINNRFKIRERLFAGNGIKTYINCRNNMISFHGLNPSSLQYITKGDFYGYFIDNTIVNENDTFIHFNNTKNVICDNAKYIPVFYNWVGGEKLLPKSESCKIIVNKAIAKFDNSCKSSKHTKVSVYLDFKITENLEEALAFKIAEDQDFKNLKTISLNPSAKYVKQAVVYVNGESKSSSIVCAAGRKLFYVGYEDYNKALPAGTYNLILEF